MSKMGEVLSVDGARRQLLVESGTYDCDRKVSEVRCAFVELQPANHAMLGEILGDARFGDAKMLGKLGFDRLRAVTTGAPPQKIADGDPQCLAGFDIVVAS